MAAPPQLLSRPMLYECAGHTRGRLVDRCAIRPIPPLHAERTVTFGSTTGKCRAIENRGSLPKNHTTRSRGPNADAKVKIPSYFPCYREIPDGGRSSLSRDNLSETPRAIRRAGPQLPATLRRPNSTCALSPGRTPVDARIRDMVRYHEP